MAYLYMVQNNAQGTNAPSAAPPSQPTGSAIRTMLQVAPAAGYPIKIVEWGCSFDGSAAATPGKVELVDTLAVSATLTTALAAGDVMIYGGVQVTPTAGVPLTFTTSGTAFASAAGTEGSVVASCIYYDLQLISPTNQYVKQFPLGREPYVTAGHFLRVRVTFAATVNMYCYVLFEV